MPNISLTIYLMHDDADVDDTVKTNLRYEVSPHEVRIAPDLAGTLLVAKGAPSQAEWARLFDDIAVPPVHVERYSHGAVLPVVAAGRVWALTFGNLGRHLVNTRKVVPRFGLRTTVNAVSKDTLRGMNVQVFDDVFRRVSEEAALDASTTNFGLDVERDLLRAVAGRPTDSKLGTMMAGADFLRVSGAFTIGEVPALLSEVLRAYMSDTYKANGFDWIDNIEVVKDVDLLNKLDEHLVAALASGPNRVALSLPDTHPEDPPVGFTYKKAAGEHNLLRLNDLLVDQGVPSASSMRSRTVEVRHESGEMTASTLYNCLVAELPVDGSNFLFSHGTWYSISGGWVADVDQALSSIPRYAKFPTYKSSHGSENEWCEDAVSVLAPGAAVADRRNISIGGGASKVEFCDLYDGNRMVFAKRYTGAPSVSHVAAQVRASVDGWHHFEPSFRQKVNKILPPQLQQSDTTVRPNTTEYTVVVALIGAPDPIPFLSRVNLRRLFDDLRRLGYQVELALVDAEPLQRVPGP